MELENMISTPITISGIPAILWGQKSDRIYIYVHGKLSCKEAARGFAEIATRWGYQVVSFDLPEHGERTTGEYPCTAKNGVHDLTLIGNYVQKNWSDIHLFAESLGAYFSLLAYPGYPVRSCLFISPILDMERLIKNMMHWSGVSEETLAKKGKIPTSFGETLDWDYYTYVREHPLERWDIPTAILYGSADNLTERDVIDTFSRRFAGEVTVMQNGEHYFHTNEQLAVLGQWLETHIQNR
jgi:uncharacterized protein